MVDWKNVCGRVVGIGFTAFVSVGAQAQAPITPGQVLETVKPRPQAEAPKAGEAPVIKSAIPGQSTGLNPNAPRFAVKRILITGNRAIDTAELQRLVDSYVDKNYNLFELQPMLAAVTAHYRQRGYPVARAVLPAQKVEAGQLTVEVIEGRVDRTQFSGNHRYDDEFLARWGQPLVDHEVQMVALEERLLLINDLPGMTARAVLRPGERYGTTTTDIAVTEDPIDGRISFNNQGREEVGVYRADAAVQFNNPLGIGDQLGLSTSQSERQLLQLYGVNYSLPIGVYGTRVATSYTYVDYDVGGDLSALDLSGHSHLASIGLSHPLLRSRNENLYSTVAVRHFSGEQFFSGESLSESKVTLFEVGLAWNRVHSDSNVSSAGLRMSSNFRDSDSGTRDNAQLFKIDGEFVHLMHLSKSWDLKLETSGMWSPDALVDAERFGLGGPSSVRGYPSAWSLGDRGVFGSIEGRYRFQVVELPVVFSVFADGGYVARKYPAVGTDESANLSSLGIGFNSAPAPWLTAEILAAVPTGDMKSADGHAGGRIWFSLTAAF